MVSTFPSNGVGYYPWRRAWQLTLVFFPGKSPWTEESTGLMSMGSQRVRLDDGMAKHKGKHGVLYELMSGY